MSLLPDTLSAEEAEQEFGISVLLIRRWCDAQRIEHTRLQGTQIYIIDRASLETFLNDEERKS